MSIINFKDDNLLPSGEFVAEVSDITYENTPYGQKYKWTFKVLEPEKYAGGRICGWTNISESCKGKLYQYVVACLKEAPKPNESIDTQSLIGMKVSITVERRLTPDEKGSTGKVTEVSQHDDFDDPFADE